MRLFCFATAIILAGLAIPSCTTSQSVPDWTPGTQVHQDSAVMLNGLSRAWELRDIAQLIEEDLATGRWRPPPSQETQTRKACQDARDHLAEHQRLIPWHASMYEPDPARLADDLASRARDLRRHVAGGDAERLRKKGEVVRQSLIDALRGPTGPQ
jgi:hypothetical protein